MTALGVRLNNPGNLRYNDRDKWQGLADPSQESGFFNFLTPVDGLRAMAITLIAYQDRMGLRTINSILNTYAPPADHNDTNRYASSVSSATGFGLDEPLDLHTIQHLKPLMQAMVRVEIGPDHPFTESQFDAALTRAGVLSPTTPVSSSTGKAAAVGISSVTILTFIGEFKDEISTGLGFVKDIISISPYVAGAIAIIVFGYFVWKHIQDRRKGIR